MLARWVPMTDRADLAGDIGGEHQRLLSSGTSKRQPGNASHISAADEGDEFLPEKLRAAAPSPDQ